MSESKPVPGDGEHDAPFPPSPAAPGLPPAASVTAEASAAGSAPAPPVEARCKCGAGPHAEDTGICARGHAMPGNTRTLKHGLYAEQPVDAFADGTGSASAPQRQQVLRRLFDAIGRDVTRYADPGRTHRLNARDQAHVLNMLDRLRDIDERLQAMDAAEPSESTGGEAPADWPQRLALHFAVQPDEFTQFAMALLEADSERCGPLRQQLRLVLDHFDPKGIPVWRGRADIADEVIL